MKDLISELNNLHSYLTINPEFINSLIDEVEKDIVNALLFEMDNSKVRFYQGYVLALRDIKYRLSSEKIKTDILSCYN